MYFKCYLSPFKQWEIAHFDHPRIQLVGEFHGLTLDFDEDNARSFDLNFTANQHVGDSHFVQLWNDLRHNGTLYLHVHVTQEGASANPGNTSYYHNAKTIHQSTSLVKVRMI